MILSDVDTATQKGFRPDGPPLDSKDLFKYDGEARIDLLRENSGVLDASETERRRNDKTMTTLKDLAANSSTLGAVLTTNGHNSVCR